MSVCVCENKMPRNSVRQSCNPCKERHLRCDREQPSCSNCRKSKYLLNCSYEPVKFKFRTSLITPPRKNVSERIRPSDPQASPPNLTPQNCREPSGGPPSPSIGSPSRSESGDLQESLDSLATRPRPPIQDAPVDTSMLVDENLASVPLSATCFPNTPSLSNPPITNVQQHATPDKTEAYIYNFYLQTAGPWVSQTTHLENVELRAENSKLDIVSPNRFFGIHVPQVAVNEPALFSACLAYAAQVLYLHGRIPSEIKTSLHDRAVTQLTPLLTSFHEGHPLGSILASTVLLRMTEQFLEIGEDHQHHLYGGSTLFQICLDEWSLFDDSLSSTSFWAYLRGSIRVSFMLERPSPCELGRLNTLQNLFTNNNNNMTDEAYANVMTYLLAEICTVVWGEPTSAVDVASKMKHLKTAIYEWRDQLPASFQPWYVEFSENDTFPDVRHLASWHCKSGGGNIHTCSEQNLSNHLVKVLGGNFFIQLRSCWLSFPRKSPPN